MYLCNSYLSKFVEMFLKCFIIDAKLYIICFFFLFYFVGLSIKLHTILLHHLLLQAVGDLLDVLEILCRQLHHLLWMLDWAPVNNLLLMVKMKLNRLFLNYALIICGLKTKLSLG